MDSVSAEGSQESHVFNAEHFWWQNNTPWQKVMQFYCQLEVGFLEALHTMLIFYSPITPPPLTPPFWIRFGHGCPYVRAALSWMAVHMASLAFSWVRNLGRNDESKTRCPDCAGAQYPIKKTKMISSQ